MSSGDVCGTLFKKILVVTADDFGYCSERNNGILECFTSGIITRASLLINGSAAGQACDFSKKFRIPMGLHLNMTEGIPISNPYEISSLLSENGCFLNRFQLLAAIQKGQIKENEIYLEIESQIKKFQRLSGGKLPYYIDGHQHVHVFPIVRKVFCKVLNNYNIKETRLPIEILDNCTWANDIENLPYLETIVEHSFEAKKLFMECSLKFPDRFIGLTTMSHNMSEERIHDLLLDAYGNTEDRIVCEIMTHPGYPCTLPNIGGCGTGADDFSRSEKRKHELDVLTSPSLRMYLKKIEVRMAPTCV